LDNVEAQIHDIDSNAAAAEAEHHQFYGQNYLIVNKNLKIDIVYTRDRAGFEPRPGFFLYPESRPNHFSTFLSFSWTTGPGQ